MGYEQHQHYATLPYEALYEGYFTTALAARAYLSLYGAMADEGEVEESVVAKKVGKEAGGSSVWGMLGAITNFKSKEATEPAAVSATRTKALATKYPYR